MLEIFLSDDQRQKVAVGDDGTYEAVFADVERNDSNEVVVTVAKGSHYLAGDEIAGP